MQRFLFFSKGFSTAISKKPKLTVYVWHSGKMTNNNQSFEKMSQHEAVLNFELSNDYKISHAACEIDFDLTSLNDDNPFRDRVSSLLISSEEHKIRDQGFPITKSVHDKIYNTLGNINQKNINAYFSLFPDISVRSIEEEQLSGIEETIGYVFGKHPPVLSTKQNDLKKYNALRLEKIELFDIDFEAILRNLEKFVIFNINDGVISPARLIEASRYYLLSVLGKHYRFDEKFLLNPQFACSTLVSHILASGMGESTYLNYLNVSQKEIGHRFAYPEIIISIAKLAKTQEELRRDSTLKL